MNTRTPRELIVPVTHRGLRYRDGALADVLEAGRYRLPRRLPFLRRPVVQIQLVDMRERELTIKGEEILTSDKVAVRVSILTQFRVTGNLQEIMNRVLAAERLSESQLVEARTQAEREQIDAESRAEQTRLQAGAEAEAVRRRAEVAELYGRHPELLRLKELETLQALGENASARLYVGFDRPAAPASEER